MSACGEDIIAHQVVKDGNVTLQESLVSAECTRNDDATLEDTHVPKVPGDIVENYETESKLNGTDFDEDVPSEMQFVEADAERTTDNFDNTFIGQLESSFKNSLSCSDHPHISQSVSSIQSSRNHLVDWMVNNANIDPIQASEYAEIFVMHGLTTEKRLAKRIKRTGDILQILGIMEHDSLSIMAALRKGNMFSTKIVGLHTYDRVISNQSSTQAPVPIPQPMPKQPELEQKSATGSDISVTLAKISSSMQNVIDANDPAEVEPMAKDVCRDIIDAAGSNADIQAALGSKGVCEDLVSILTIYTSSSSRVVQNALCAMSVLCRRKQDEKNTECLDNVKKLGQVRACQCAIAAMKKYEDSLLVIKWATSCVRNLCSVDANRAFFAHSGASLALMQICHKYKTNEDVLRWVLRAMGKLARNNDNRMSLVHHGYCEFVLEAMSLHHHNSLVIADCCWALRAVASGDQSCRSKLVQLRACETVSDVLKEHFRIDVVVTEACRALVAFVKDSDDTVRRLILAGRLNVFVLPLLGTEDTTQYTSFAQTSSCGESSAVACLIALYTISSVDIARTAFLDCGAFEAIVSVLNHNSMSTDVALWACKCVHRLSSSQLAHSRTRKSRICECLVHVLQRDMTKIDASIAEWTGLALSILAVDKLNRESLFAVGACHELTAVLRHHKENPDVAYRICGAIHFMSLDDNSRSQLGVEGACEVVTEVLRYHSQHAKSLETLDSFHEGAVQASARAIGSLAFENKSNCAYFISCGACDVVLLSATIFQKSPAMTEFCCRAVSRLCDDEESRTCLSSQGAVKSVVDALRRFPHSEAVVKHGLFALGALTNCEQCAAETGVNNVRELQSERTSLSSIVSALQLHATASVEIAHTGCKVLGSLLKSETALECEVPPPDTPKYSADTTESACKVLISCLKFYPKEESVQSEGISSLSYLLKTSAELPHLLGGLGYIDIVMSSLRQHSSNRDIVLYCFLTLSDMIAVRANHDMLCSAKGCESIIVALKHLYKLRDIARCVI
jgi:hypothetical protein